MYRIVKLKLSNIVEINLARGLLAYYYVRGNVFCR